MLTDVGYQAGSLAPEQIARVEMLVEQDRIMRPIAPGFVGEWMVEPNPASLLVGFGGDRLSDKARRARVCGAAAAGPTMGGQVSAICAGGLSRAAFKFSPPPIKSRR